MQERGTEVKLVITSVLGFFTAFWGWMGWLVFVFVVAVFMDLFTGYALAAKNGAWSSSIAWQGLYKKVASFIVVAAGGLLDLVILLLADNVASIQLPYQGVTGGLLFLPVVTVWSILGELGSILENAGNLGAPVPQFLVGAIKVLQSKAKVGFDKPDLSGEEKNT